ncbi:Zinc finger RING/FYVE/PHD-type protein [Dioscorea alata]|nr:Zinc finger RING/FYVE/PHD-type protein [Dioscorea alata]KAH7659145.1 Zinc finger RING/FYVE/PHD-type protein [Dioscorea alata]
MIVNQTTRTRVESGTCNVCSAPCSSCMHINRTTSVMESNVEGTYSINKLRREEADSCSYDGPGGLPLYKSRACDDPQHATSETSNLLSVSSSHDSYSENAESKSTLIATNDVSEDVEMHPKLSVEAVGEGGLLPKETNISSSCVLSSKSNPISVPHQEPFRSGKEEQRDLECHGDNISCATGGLDAAIAVNVCNVDMDGKDPVIGVASTESEIAEGIERKTQLEAGNLCLDDEIRECKVKVEEPNACQKDILQKKDSGSFVKDQCSNKSDCADHSSLKLNSAKVEPSEYFTADMELSTRVAEASANVKGEKTILPDHEDRRTCQLKSVSPSGTQKSGYSCLETRNHRENDVTGDKDCEAVKCSTTESDIEDDVKVCDICGDAGREECLAVCSKCSDGAEHTYCMRIMLEKIPEGDWLCEECKLKEDTENDEVDRTEMVQEKLEVQSLKENVVSSETVPSPKVSLRLDLETSDQEATGVVKRTHSQHVSAHRLTDNTEVSSFTGKRSAESNGSSIETSSPRKKVALSCDSSLKKLDLTKGKLANMTSSIGSHSGHSSPQAFVKAQMSGSYPSKVQTQVQTPRGSLSRSMSLNNSGMKGKVKQLTENIPHKPKLTKEFSSKDTRKDGIVRTATKNASFRTIGSSRLNVESTIKTQFLNSPRSEDSKSFKHPKDRNLLEKKNSFKLDHTPVTPSTSTAVPSKAELKGAQISGKSNNVSESNIVSVTKRLGDANDLGHSEVKKQPLNAPKALGSSSLNSLGQKSYSMRSTKSSIQPETVPQHEDKSKDSNLFSSSRQAGPSGGRVLRCQKCNETGHATQFCSIDKLRVSALKPSAERNLKEATVKSDRWKDAVEALLSKTKVQKDGRSPDHADSSTVTPRSSREVGPKDVPTSSSNSFQGGLISRQEVFRSSATSPGLTGAAIGVKQPDNHQVETCIPVDRQLKALPTALKELTGLPSVPTMTDRCSDQGRPMRVSVFPELEFIWQGDFEVLRAGRLLEPCNGVQAHLSTCASPKVLEVVNKFPGKVKLEEVPRSSSWPLQFQRISPKDDNIALFLFARDIESYENNYKKLLENMLKNDLALKGFIDEVELLIFPSNKLPENSQRWNNLFFLWAVFRERRINCSDALPGPQRPCKSSLQEELLVQDSPLLLASDFSTSKNINLHEFPTTDSSKFEMLPKAGIVENNTQMSSEAVGELQCEISPCPDLGNPITTSPLCLEQNSGVASPKISAPVQVDRCAEPRKNKIFGNDAMGGIDVETSNNVQNSLNKHGALPILPVTCASTACGDGCEFSANLEKLQETTVLGSDPHDCMTSADNLSWESKSSRKRARSRSVDANLQASGETLKVVDETMTGKETMNHRAEHIEKDHKKAKLCNDDGLAAFPEPQRHRETIMDETKDNPESSRSVERFVFPFDLNSISCEETETETEIERVIHVLSSDDEDIEEPVIPDLELALGGKKKPVKNERQPLIFPIVSSKINQHQRPAVRQNDYASASLSLSLAIPKSENEETVAGDVQQPSFWQL